MSAGSEAGAASVLMEPAAAATAVTEPAAASTPRPAGATSATPAMEEAGAATPRDERKLFHAATSVEDLVRQVLAAVDAEDMQGLTDLRVTEREHNELLWPEFSAKDHNVDLDFAWDMLNTRSHTNQGRTIGTWRGQGLDFTAVRFERGVESYKTFTLHRGTLVAARTAQGGDVDLRFIGSILELDGQFKVLSYKDRD
jgi:hypothetical protein